MGYDIFNNPVKPGKIIAPGPTYPDGSAALEACLRHGARNVQMQGTVIFNAPVVTSKGMLEMEIPSGSRIIVDHTDPNYGVGAFGLEDVAIVGRGRIESARYVAGQALVAFAALRAHIGGGIVMDYQDATGAGTAMKGVWFNGCTEADIDGLTVYPNRKFDSVVVNGGSRLDIERLKITNGAQGALESYVPRRSGAPLTISNCTCVDIGKMLLYGIGLTAPQGEALPLDYGIKISADATAEHGHVNVHAFRNFSFNCKVGIWLCGVPWFNIGDDCYFCTQGILCNGVDDAAILLDSADSTDGNTKKSGPGSIGKVHIHNTGLSNSNGIYVKRARDVKIQGAFVSDIRNKSAVLINTPQVRNITVDDLTALLAFDASASALAPVVMANGAADGINIGKITYGRQKSDAGAGPVAWNGTVPIHNIGGVTGTLRTRGLWDATNAKMPSTAATATNMDGISTNVPLT